MSQTLSPQLQAHLAADRLRFMVCGHVDDGKSTLIGRLLLETGTVHSDQLDTVRRESARAGRLDLDAALLLDGLLAEREQGITIDVAYRYFGTPSRHFIVADCPGHAQYTRNMATAASVTDLAVLLIDATHGMRTQTRRHLYIAHLMGITQFIVAVNKIDLVGYSNERFEHIAQELRDFVDTIPDVSLTPIPVSGLLGDNVVSASSNTPWFEGPTLLEALETAPSASRGSYRTMGLRLPIQFVNRNGSSRAYCGTLMAGSLAAGDDITVLPSGTRSRVIRIDADTESVAAAEPGAAVRVTLAHEVDVSRGDVITAGTRPQVANTLLTTLMWFGSTPLTPATKLVAKIGTAQIGAKLVGTVTRINTDDHSRSEEERLVMHEIGTCTLELDRNAVFDAYADNRLTGCLILIDRITRETVAAGMILQGSRSTDSLEGSAARIAGQGRAAVVWLTGLSGAGKSTIATQLHTALMAEGVHSYILDGDQLRDGLNKDLGFEAADRNENVRRIGEVAALMADAGVITIVACISPYAQGRQDARERVGPTFLEVHVDTPLEVAEARDPKGLYRKARQGRLQGLTGVDSPYERPAEPNLRILTTELSPQQAASQVVESLRIRGLLDRRCTW